MSADPGSSRSTPWQFAFAKRICRTRPTALRQPWQPLQAMTRFVCTWSLRSGRGCSSHPRVASTPHSGTTACRTGPALCGRETAMSQLASA
eukprot:1504626-Alexandrium_andersonii.AAC.1